MSTLSWFKANKQITDKVCYVDFLRERTMLTVFDLLNNILLPPRWGLKHPVYKSLWLSALSKNASPTLHPSPQWYLEYVPYTWLRRDVAFLYWSCPRFDQAYSAQVYQSFHKRERHLSKQVQYDLLLIFSLTNLNSILVKLKWLSWRKILEGLHCI